MKTKIVLGLVVAATVPAIASAHGWPIWGKPAPAPELAAGIPAALSMLGAFAATRFKRSR